MYVDQLRDCSVVVCYILVISKLSNIMSMADLEGHLPRGQDVSRQTLLLRVGDA